jgi:methyl-accepting chemotaxis protein
MTVKSKKDRIAAMIASLKRAAAGDYSKTIDISGKHDEFDSLAEAMENDKTIGWISAMENGSPVLSELIEAHSLSKKYRIDPKTPYTTKSLTKVWN